MCMRVHMRGVRVCVYACVCVYVCACVHVCMCVHFLGEIFKGGGWGCVLHVSITCVYVCVHV